MKTLTLENGTTIKVTDEQLQELMKSQKTESSIGWTPEIGEMYTYLVKGNLIRTITNNNVPFDRELFEIGNCYKTETEAQRVLDKKKALRRIHEYMYKNDLVYVPDWNVSNDDYKYQIEGWFHTEDRPTLCQYFCLNNSKGNLVFRTEQDRQKVLDNCKEDLEIYLKD